MDISQPGCELTREAHEVFASLIDYFRDYRDCASEYSESSKFAVYDEMQSLVDELQRLQVVLHYATREVHLTFTTDRSGEKPLKVHVSYLLAFERGTAPAEFAVSKKLDFPS